MLISYRCNQQIPASSLLVKGPDVTRSTVQKAVVVLASKPVFGPIRYVILLSPHRLKAEQFSGKSFE